MNKHLIHLGVTFVITVAVCVGYGFWYAALSAKSVAVASLQERIQARTESVKRIALAREALSEIAGDEALMQNYFVPENGVVAFIDILEGKGRAQGVVTNILSVSQGTAKQPTFELSLTLAGTFDAVMRTIGAIEYAPYKLSVTKLLVTQGEVGNWRADLTLLVGSLHTTSTTP
jgi:hypothetical protein